MDLRKGRDAHPSLSDSSRVSRTFLDAVNCHLLLPSAHCLLPVVSAFASTCHSLTPGALYPDCGSCNGSRVIECWRPPQQAQHCSALTHTLEHSEHPREMYQPNTIDSRRSSLSFMLFSISSSVSLYAIHTRTSPPDSTHRHVLQTLALPRRVTAFTTRRTIHAPRNHDRINKIVLGLDAMFNVSPGALC